MLTITKPIDCHIHLRDGEFLARTVPDAAAQFSAAIVMPNLIPPLTTIEAISAYRQRILQHNKTDSKFTPHMTIFLNENVTIDTLVAAKNNNIIGCKYYPQGATTNSEYGTSNIEKLYPLIAQMEELDIPLLVHGEVADGKIDIFAREKIFLDEVASVLTRKFPKLRLVLEHITTKDAVDFVKASNNNVAATITAHHLWLDRNDLLSGGIRPHYYCLPILKKSEDREALIKAAISGVSQFFLGTDSAPHIKENKESACGCAGVYTAYNAIEFYAEIFDNYNALDALDNFASGFATNFYKLEPINETITLVKKDTNVPESLRYAGKTLIPFKQGEVLKWQIKTN